MAVLLRMHHVTFLRWQQVFTFKAKALIERGYSPIISFHANSRKHKRKPESPPVIYSNMILNALNAIRNIPQ